MNRRTIALHPVLGAVAAGVLAGLRVVPAVALAFGFAPFPYSLGQGGACRLAA